MWMRGGSSKGGYFLRDDLPSDPARRDAVVLRVMGANDPAQIDGMGGGHPLTSKVAIVGKSANPAADVDFQFLQVTPGTEIVSADQNCGNILAGIAPFAVERGLVAAGMQWTLVRVNMLNSNRLAHLHIPTPGGRLDYDAAPMGGGSDGGMPESGMQVRIDFRDVAGSSCGALLPTGRPLDLIEGADCTLIDNGMPCVVIAASDMGVSGYEAPAELEANEPLKRRLEAIRLSAGRSMNLGYVAAKPVPKILLVAPPREGGMLCVRSFIPHRVHKSLGVLAGTTVATAATMPDSVAGRVARPVGGDERVMEIEHPGGSMTCVLGVGADGAVTSSAVVRTARKLMDGVVFA